MMSYCWIHSNAGFFCSNWPSDDHFTPDPNWLRVRCTLDFVLHCNTWHGPPMLSLWASPPLRDLLLLLLAPRKVIGGRSWNSAIDDLLTPPGPMIGSSKKSNPDWMDARRLPSSPSSGSAEEESPPPPPLGASGSMATRAGRMWITRLIRGSFH